jgi:tRNA 5-methylaminomethyl-2-thiouridine biosynthesis bifunctional protein
MAVRTAIEHHGVAGSAKGLLRLESSLTPSEMQAVLNACKLPADYAQAASASTASQLSGLHLTQAAWHYVEGGWVQPAGLVRGYFERAGSGCQLRTHCAVETLRRCERGWQLLDAQGNVIEEAEVIVLANAADAARLLSKISPNTLASLAKVRGQISQLPSDTAGLPQTKLPLTGAGYLLPSWQGRTLFGATSNEGDDDPSVRASDHASNLAQLAVLTQTPALSDLNADTLQGRTAWRCVAPDRLPVIGGVPQEAGRSIDQPRLIARWPGLFVYTALGSRGITWSALGGQTLAAWVTGCPSPVEASLLDAVDPARFAARHARGLSKTTTAGAPSKRSI